MFFVTLPVYTGLQWNTSNDICTVSYKKTSNIIFVVSFIFVRNYATYFLEFKKTPSLKTISIFKKKKWNMTCYFTHATTNLVFMKNPTELFAQFITIYGTKYTLG